MHNEQGYQALIPKPTLEPGAWERDRRRDRATEIWESIPEGKKLLNREANPRIVSLTTQWQWGDGSLALLGRSGVGKTTAAVQLVRRLLAGGVRTGEHWDRVRFIRWVKAADVANVVKQSPLGSTPDLLQRCRNARLLVIDDLGLEMSSDTSMNDLMKARYDVGLPTIVTSHLRWPELKARYGSMSRWLIEGDIMVPGKFVEVFQ